MKNKKNGPCKLDLFICYYIILLFNLNIYYFLLCIYYCFIPGLRQDADDMCMICFTEALWPIPSIQLECGHVFHYQCCTKILEKRWSGPRITFGFRNCPICKAKMEHDSLKPLLDPIGK